MKWSTTTYLSESDIGTFKIQSKLKKKEKEKEGVNEFTKEQGVFFLT